MQALVEISSALLYVSAQLTPEARIGNMLTHILGVSQVTTLCDMGKRAQIHLNRSQALPAGLIL